ncbi:MAG TPA: hypothetical protein RMH99_22220, partial [Sandaracinaceae bacterium LLY-WYZ-13_1]|nr:hypothetical protein [Sandaracinaceae bacterium LLY-WYZ-13_1]
MSFSVGANFPWVTCGHDFGPRPVAWAGAPPTDWAAVEAELRALRRLGVSLVRWWLLAGGVNYPVGTPAEAVARRVPFDPPAPWWAPWRRGRRRRPALERWAPTGPPPALPRAFLDDVERLLAAAARAGVRLVPSLLSFELLLPIRDHRGG